MYRRLITVQHEFADQIAASGGLLKTGFYNLDVDVKDLQGRMETALTNFGKYPFLNDLLSRPQGGEVKAAERVAAVLESEGYEVFQYVEDAAVRYPQLHMKSHFYASPEAWDTFFKKVNVAELSAAYARAWVRQLNDQEADPTEFQKELGPILEPILESVKELPQEEQDRVMVYLCVGSSNMSARSFFLDGEVAYISTRGGVLTGALDLIHVMNVSDWVDDESELDQYMGSWGWFTRHLGRWATPLM
jgi:hypothetical protein